MTGARPRLVRDHRAGSSKTAFARSVRANFSRRSRVPSVSTIDRRASDCPSPPSGLPEVAQPFTRWARWFDQALGASCVAPPTIRACRRDGVFPRNGDGDHRLRTRPIRTRPIRTRPIRPEPQWQGRRSSRAPAGGLSTHAGRREHSFPFEDAADLVEGSRDVV